MQITATRPRRLDPFASLLSPALVATMAPPPSRAGLRRHAVASLLDTGDAVEVRLELAGVAPENISVELADDSLVVTASRVGLDERWAGQLATQLERRFTVGPGFDVDAVSARWHAGELVVTLPRRTAAASRAVPVQVVDAPAELTEPTAADPAD